MAAASLCQTISSTKCGFNSTASTYASLTPIPSCTVVNSPLKTGSNSSGVAGCLHAVPSSTSKAFSNSYSENTSNLLGTSKILNVNNESTSNSSSKLALSNSLVEKKKTNTICDDNMDGLSDNYLCAALSDFMTVTNKKSKNVNKRKNTTNFSFSHKRRCNLDNEQLHRETTPSQNRFLVLATDSIDMVDENADVFNEEINNSQRNTSNSHRMRTSNEDSSIGRLDCSNSSLKVNSNNSKSSSGNHANSDKTGLTVKEIPFCPAIFVTGINVDLMTQVINHVFKSLKIIEFKYKFICIGFCKLKVFVNKPEVHKGIIDYLSGLKFKLSPSNLKSLRIQLFSLRVLTLSPNLKIYMKISLIT